MSERPRTMTAENEERINQAIISGIATTATKLLKRELDAERAAHDSSEQTIRELRENLRYLRDWKSPDGVLQVKNLEWFKELERK